MTEKAAEPASLFWVVGAWHTTPPMLIGPADHAFWQSSVVFDGAHAIRGCAPDIDLHAARARSLYFDWMESARVV